MDSSGERWWVTAIQWNQLRTYHLEAQHDFLFLDIQTPAEKVFGPPNIPDTPSPESFGCLRVYRVSASRTHCLNHFLYEPTCAHLSPRYTFTLGLAQWSREGENSEVFMSLSKESWPQDDEIFRHPRIKQCKWYGLFGFLTETQKQCVMFGRWFQRFCMFTPQNWWNDSKWPIYCVKWITQPSTRFLSWVISPTSGTYPLRKIENPWKEDIKATKTEISSASWTWICWRKSYLKIPGTLLCMGIKGPHPPNLQPTLEPCGSQSCLDFPTNPQSWEPLTISIPFPVLMGVVWEWRFFLEFPLTEIVLG